MYKHLPFITLLCFGLALLGTKGIHAARSKYSPGPGYDYCDANYTTPAKNLAEELLSGTFEITTALVFTRHGDRSAINTLPGKKSLEIEWNCNLKMAMSLPDILDDVQPTEFRRAMYSKEYIKGREVLRGNCGLGRLTQKGQQQHHKLGKNIRQRYVTQLGFLSDTLDNTEMYIRSTDRQRTLMSAQAFLWGLYPLDKRDLNQENVAIPIHTIDSDKDGMYPNKKLCPALTEAYAKQRVDEAYLSHLEKHKVLIETLYEVYHGERMDYEEIEATPGLLLDIMYSSDNLLVRKCTGHKTPGITDEIMKEFTEELVPFMWAFEFDPIAELAIGHLLADIEAILKEKTPTFKFRLFSGHDTTIGPLLAAVKRFDGQGLIPYASHIEIEVWQETTTKEEWVTFAFNGRYLAIPGCEKDICTKKEFLSILARSTPNSLEEDCHVDESHHHSEEDTAGYRDLWVILFMGILIGMIIGIGTALLVYYMRFRKTEKPTISLTELVQVSDMEGGKVH